MKGIKEVTRSPLYSDSLSPYNENRAVDKVAQIVASCLPTAKMERTRDFYQFTQEDPEGFVVLVTPEVIEFRLPTVEWTQGYAGPVACSRMLKRAMYKHKGMSPKKLHTLIQWGRDARRAETKPCCECGEPTPPEHAHEIEGDWICHGCSERFRGIVH